ncbi:MAG: LiaI-LiaF-like domain-containing protein [Bacillota bacterium]
MTGRLVNGLVLVVVGALLLMNTSGYLPWSIWDAAVSYWPVLLIGLGLQIALPRREIPMLALAVVVVLILGAMNPYGGWRNSWIRWDGIQFNWPGRNWRPMDHTKEWVVPLNPSVSRIDLELKAPSLELEARGNPGLNEKSPAMALWADISWDRTEPHVSYSERDNELKALIDAPDQNNSNDGKQNWEIDLNPSLSTSLRVSAGVANVDLNCASVFLQDVDIKAGVADLDLTLGLTGKDTRVKVAGGAASVAIEVPQSAGLRVSISSPFTITHDLEEEGLVRSGNTWATPEYESASTKVDVTVSCGAGSVKVDRTD